MSFFLAKDDNDVMIRCTVDKRMGVGVHGQVFFGGIGWLGLKSERKPRVTAYTYKPHINYNNIL